MIEAWKLMVGRLPGAAIEDAAGVATMFANVTLPLPKLAFCRVADETTARELAMLNAQACGFPAGLFECLCNLYLRHDDSFGFVGYAAGKAVTCAAAFPVCGTM